MLNTFPSWGRILSGCLTPDDFWLPDTKRCTKTYNGHDTKHIAAAALFQALTRFHYSNKACSKTKRHLLAGPQSTSAQGL